MESKTKRFFTDEEIKELDIDELSVAAGGIEVTLDINGMEVLAANQVKCPKCNCYVPIRSLKEHLRVAHKM